LTECYQSFAKQFETYLRIFLIVQLQLASSLIQTLLCSRKLFALQQKCF